MNGSCLFCRLLRMTSGAIQPSSGPRQQTIPPAKMVSTAPRWVHIAGWVGGRIGGAGYGYPTGPPGYACPGAPGPYPGPYPGPAPYGCPGAPGPYPGAPGGGTWPGGGP